MSLEVRLRRYPAGLVTADDFEIVNAPTAEPGDDEVEVAVDFLSMDPVVRTRMTAAPAMGPPLALGTVVPGRGVGRVTRSRAPSLPVGTRIYGELGWRDTAVLPAAMLETLPAGAALLNHHLNALGPTGLAAWFVVETAAVRPGDIVFIAPAAGAVGSLVAQLALNLGARVAGTGLGIAQLDYLQGLGVEAVAPDGELPAAIDVFIDGVGGALHDRAVARLNSRARVVLLGFLADYGNDGPPRYGSMGPILMKRARVEGFLLADHMARAGEARGRLAAGIASGALKPAETIWAGLDQAPHAFAALFADAAPGKQLVRVRSDV